MTGLKNNVSPPSNQICRAQQASRPCHLEFFALAMVRMCRLAPTMATLILAPWEFWLSCKNWDRGGNTDLCHSQEGVCVCGAAGGRWVTRRLQGSDPLDLWPNSISPASLDHHYQTLSLRLSRIANLGGKKRAIHTLLLLTLLPFARPRATIGGSSFCRSQATFWESAKWCLGGNWCYSDVLLLWGWSWGHSIKAWPSCLAA